jgi:hypothetical protein
MSQIEAVIAAIESLEPGEQFRYHQLAIESACSHTTLARRHQGLAFSRSTMAETSKCSTRSKSRSSYDKSESVLSEAYHLPEL